MSHFLAYDGVLLWDKIRVFDTRKPFYSLHRKITLMSRRAEATF